MRKLRILCFFVIALMLTSASAFAISGDGSESSPFIITNQEELRLVDDFPSSNYILANDIELDNNMWASLCRTGDAFCGTFNGNGHTISNLYLNGSETNYTDYHGLFSSNSGKIFDLNVSLTDAYLWNKDVDEDNVQYYGSICGLNSGSIYNCKASVGTIYVYGEFNSYRSGNYTFYHKNRTTFGGIVGTGSPYTYTTINDCLFTANDIKLGTEYDNTYHYEYIASFFGIGAGTNEIRNCSVSVDTIYCKDYSLTSGIGSGGVIKGCSALINNINAVMNGKEHDYTYFYGIGGDQVDDSYVISKTGLSSTLSRSYGISAGNISNSYAAIAKCEYGATLNGTATNCFYDKTLSTYNEKDYGKSTTAMKMKATYTNAGWDFDTVWGIDETGVINEGYPYLLWEYPSENVDSSASVDIVDTYANNSNLSIYSALSIQGDPQIKNFGTIFIPKALFDEGSEDVAIVKYDNSEYDVEDGNIFEATLTGIPENFKTKEFIIKSFVVDGSNDYIYSSTITASYDNPSID